MQRGVIVKKKNADFTAVEVIAATVKESIEHGTLKPGDKLPTLQQMENTYCVSRNVIREAIKVLEGMQYLHSRQGSGIYVSDPLPVKEQDGAVAKEYSLWEIFSLFEAIYAYALFEIKTREDLSEVEDLQKLNEKMLKTYSSLTVHQKFAYEASFGVRLVKLSKNALAQDIYLKMIKPMTGIDSELIKNTRFIEILKLDQKFIQSILNRDPYMASFWAHERNAITIDVFKNKADFWQKKYVVFD